MRMGQAPLDWDQDQLRREASLIHHATFGREVPEEVARRYAEAHAQSLLRSSPSQRAWIQRVLDAGADLEAVEVALRAGSPDHILCTKFRLLVYIAEAFPEYYEDFINEKPRHRHALLVLGFQGFRTIVKRIKGGWLLRRLV